MGKPVCLSCARSSYAYHDEANGPGQTKCLAVRVRTDLVNVLSIFKKIGRRDFAILNLTERMVKILRSSVVVRIAILSEYKITVIYAPNFSCAFLTGFSKIKYESQVALAIAGPQTSRNK